MIPEVVQVIPANDYKVYVYFLDGKIVCYDVKPLLEGPVFKSLKDKTFFAKRCTVLNGTLAWDTTGTRDESECIDIDPETLYELDEITDEKEVFKNFIKN